MITQARMIGWFRHYDNMAFVSFSGGMDSSVLSDIAARVCRALDTKLVLWFCDTGLEYPEIRSHVKFLTDWIRGKHGIDVDLVIDVPTDKKTGERITFKKALDTHGYPVVSKEVSEVIKGYRRNLLDPVKYEYQRKKAEGELLDKDGNPSEYNLAKKWRFLKDAPFKISDDCCLVMKKNPSKQFIKSSGRLPIIGTMATESRLRQTTWLRNGCNNIDSITPKSTPMAFWTEQDVYEYTLNYQIPMASVYGEIVKDNDGVYSTTGVARTGCVFCLFGIAQDTEPNRLQRLKESHPPLHEYCLKSVADGGIGLKDVCVFIGIDYE